VQIQNDVSRALTLGEVNIHNIIITIPNYSQLDTTFLDLFILQTLYMFQAVPPPIIRST